MNNDLGFDPPEDDHDWLLGDLTATAWGHSLASSLKFLEDGRRESGASIYIWCRVNFPEQLKQFPLEVVVHRQLDPPISDGGAKGQGIGRLLFRDVPEGTSFLTLAALSTPEDFETFTRTLSHAPQAPDSNLFVAAQVIGIDRNWTRSSFLVVQSLKISARVGEVGIDRKRD